MPSRWIPAGSEAALREFDNFVNLLRRHQVNVLVIEDSPEPFTPDSIFPNNWISFQEHAGYSSTHVRS